METRRAGSSLGAVDLKTTWRYCISRERVEAFGDWFTIREVYEGDDGSLSWTEEPIVPGGESWRELANDLSLMAAAANGNILDLTLDPPALVHPTRSPAPKMNPQVPNHS